MPIIASNTITVGAAFAFAMANEKLTVARGVIVASTGADGVITNYGRSTVANYGLVSGANDGLSGAVTINGGTNSVVMNAAGGSISGGFGVLSFSTSTQVINHGSINGVDTGVDSEVAWNLKVTNDGLIYGGIGGVNGANGLAVDNSGIIAGGSYGVFISFGAHQRASVVNAGTIRGRSDAVFAAGSGSVTMHNTGKLVGGVQFGDGANLFDGRGGTVSGKVVGGAGVDTMIAGADGETLAGGAGHDQLTAGAGADTFVFSSFAGADSDTIHGFDVKRDTIDFAPSVFRKLTAGKSPLFAVASHATSAKDFVFYNASNGGLYYDPDGSGSGRASLIATLDKGLAMTASDFKVI